MGNILSRAYRIIVALLIMIFALSSHTEASLSGMLTYSIDDGHHSAYDIALPILRSHNQIGTVNMVSSYVGKSKWLNRQQLLELQNNGWEVCSHSEMHPHFSKIPQTYEDELLNGWSLAEGRNNTFKTNYNYDELPLLYENNLPLLNKNNIAKVESNPGSCFFDKANNEIYVHTFDSSNPSGQDIRADSVQRELEQSKQELSNMGIRINNFIVPYHDWTDEREYLAQKYYNSVGAGPQGIWLNDIPITDKYNLVRLVVTSNKTVDQLKWWVDRAIDENNWLILCFHYFGENDGFGDSMYWSADKLEEFSTWVEAQNISVVTQQEGVEMAKVPICNSWIMLLTGLIILIFLGKTKWSIIAYNENSLP